ncbi:MAG TPA: EpsD family peptidyl-prolyl cis-trans isomerase [Aquabacterium sp.]|uniref:EpsD family peptidyl-prolyl cis-trans isomerase n=1 Tax=Aquabacterium sp. TaxID=1872578 RepID=UPI002E301342|nr:EpsD family peptidyl-prolyl cis-trans isomerase [Aquabacterium sp.]HEX5355468.1 EpsD family peptidyl-prolyl cis-trans isomerase [Aquabacterium sp.]
MPWFSHKSVRRAAGVFGRVAGVSLLMTLAACPSKDKPAAPGDTSQIVAKVNDSEISIHQVQSVLQSQPALIEQLGEAAPGKVLDSLIEQELAAQAARQAGLDSSPRVLQAMELAKREVLARAYQDQLADKIVMPDSEAVNRYYEAHPELFAQRRRYTLQEIIVKGSPEQVKDLKDKVEHLATAEAVNALVSSTGLPHSNRNSIQWAEALPMEILPQLAYLKAGQSLGVVRPDGIVVLTVLATEDAPMTRSVAARPIQAALLATSRREVVSKGMEALRSKAKIQRLGPLAAAASAPSQAAAASAP